MWGIIPLSFILTHFLWGLRLPVNAQNQNNDAIGPSGCQCASRDINKSEPK